MPEPGATFDHLIHWVNDLDSAMAEYQACGLATHHALEMPGFRNGAWGVDDERYVELATVTDWQAVSTSKYAQGVEILRPAVESMSGPGLVTFAVDVPDAESLAEHFRQNGRLVEVVQVFFEEQNAGFTEVFLRDAPAYFPFFISYSPPRAEIGRLRAECRRDNGISLEGTPDLAALLVGSPEPEAEAQQLAELVGCSVRGATVALPGAEVRFSSRPTSGLYGIAVRGLDTSAHQRMVQGMTVCCET